MRKIVIIGNWKMHKTIAQTQEFLNTYQKLSYGQVLPSNLEVGLAMPTTSLFLAQKYSSLLTYFAAENMHDQNFGAYTGEISPSMIKATGANAVILGHSERRQLFHETDDFINAKVHAALAQGLKPIVCIGETLAEYEAKQTQAVLKGQLAKSLAQIRDFTQVIIAYEPIWAIGTGKTPTTSEVDRVCAFIRSLTSDDVIIQYGGSVKPENIASFLTLANVNGALVGGASLQPELFAALVKQGIEVAND